MDIIDVLCVGQASYDLVFSVSHHPGPDEKSVASLFTGEKDVVRAAQKLNRYAPAVVVTRGEAGLVWQTAEGSGQLDAFAVEAVDSTGAGDAFHGAFAAGLSEKMDWPELLRYSSAAGALTCTRYGARPAIPDVDAVDRFLKTVNK